MAEYYQYPGFWTPSPLELVVVLAVLVLVFGKRLPDIARSIGKSMTEFKKGLNETKDTKDQFVEDIKKSGDDAIKQAGDASGLNDSENNK